MTLISVFNYNIKRKIFRNLAPAVIAGLILCVLSACSKEDDPDLPDVPTTKPITSVVPVEPAEPIAFPLEKNERTLLIYAVASNNLSSFWESDVKEMLTAAQILEHRETDFRIAVYCVTPHVDQATLSLISKEDGQWQLTIVRKYDREIFSTDPKRISEVIGDVREMMPSDNYGLVFWSHATGWTPSPKQVSKAYGRDEYKGVSDECDITDLADAIPENMFDFVWFDCCYMGASEVAYELAPKVPNMVAYLSEVWAEGIPYDIILPYIAGKDLNIEEGANKLADYFKAKSSAYSVALYDLRSPELDNLPKIFGDIVNVAGDPDLSQVQTYHRKPYGPFYDIGDLVRNVLDESVEEQIELGEQFSKALDSVVRYSDCYTKSFSGSIWYPERCSGMTVHWPDANADPEDKAEQFYRSTRWGSVVTSRLTTDRTQESGEELLSENAESD